MLATRSDRTIRDQPGDHAHRPSALRLAVLLVGCAAALAACGGGSSSSSDGAAASAGAGGGAAAAPAAGAAASGTPSAGASPSGAPAAASPGSSPVADTASAKSAEPSALASAAVKLINDARALGQTCGTTPYAPAGPITWNTQVEAAATTQSQYLQSANAFSHTGAGGSSVGDRLSATGYRWSAVGENIAAGYADVGAVIQGWLASPGHCANLMNPAFADIGLALQAGAAGNTYPTYWTLVLAHARP
jgi:uncharacterized protein YkwD